MSKHTDKVKQIQIKSIYKVKTNKTLKIVISEYCQKARHCELNLVKPHATQSC